jgi:predicted nucleic acid-binding protein
MIDESLLRYEDTRLSVRCGRTSEAAASAQAFWDALIVRSAIEGGASKLYSEDLQHAQVFGTLTVENPMR